MLEHVDVRTMHLVTTSMVHVQVECVKKVTKDLIVLAVSILYTH